MVVSVYIMCSFLCPHHVLIPVSTTWAHSGTACAHFYVITFVQPIRVHLLLYWLLIGSEVKSGFILHGEINIYPAW